VPSRASVESVSPSPRDKDRERQPENPPYRSSRNDSWIKVKNPAAPAAKRVDEEDWSK
jgi:hypothetical protein